MKKPKQLNSKYSVESTVNPSYEFTRTMDTITSNTYSSDLQKLLELVKQMPPEQRQFKIQLLQKSIEGITEFLQKIDKDDCTFLQAKGTAPISEDQRNKLTSHWRPRLARTKIGLRVTQSLDF